MKKLMLIIIVIAAISRLFCQDPKIYIEPLQSEQGLTDHEFNCIMQDHKGFIWLGAKNGLYRHNGYEITLVSAQLGCESCSFGGIYKILEDRFGLLWLYTTTGLRIYDPEKERSMLVYPQLVENSEPDNWTNYNMVLDSTGNIWSSCKTGLIKISCTVNSRKQVTRETIFKSGPKRAFTPQHIFLSPQKDSPENLVGSLYVDAPGNIWVGSMDGLYLFRKGSSDFIRMDKGISRENQNSLLWVTGILQIDEDSYFILSMQKLYLLTNVKNLLISSNPTNALLNVKLIHTPGTYISFLSVDRKKNILLGVDKKVYLIRKLPESNEISFEEINFNPANPNNFIVNNLCEDRSGIFWTTRENIGALKFKMGNLLFTKYENLKIHNLENSTVNYIQKDNHGDLWISLNTEGLYKVQPLQNKVTRYDPGPGKIITCFKPSSSREIFWIGCDEGMLELNPHSGKFRDLIHDSKLADTLRWATVFDILEDRGQLYLATSLGVFVYTISDKKLYRLSPDHSVSLYEAFSLIKLNDGEIWTAIAQKGILKIHFDPKSGIFSLEPVTIQDIPIDFKIDILNLNRLFQDKNGFIWITDESGIHRANQKNGEITHFKLFDNTDFQHVLSATPDDHNNLWLGTRSRLCRFNMTDAKVDIFEECDGIPALQYSRNSVFRDKEGRIYFGGTGGFYSFYPDSLKTNTYIPPVVITDFLLFNKSVKVKTSGNTILTRNISYTKSIDLQHNQNDLTFEFAALDYNQPSRNKYAYKLEGYDKEWISTDSKSRIATYTNLDPGTYVFKVKGSNNQGIWNNEGTSLTIEIHRTWWASLFALSIYILVSLCLILGYTRWRLWQLKRDKLELESQVNLRTRQIEEQKEEILAQKDMLEMQNQQIVEHEQLKSRFFTNVSHEFRTPLSLIQSPIEELLDDPRRVEKDRRKLNMVQRNVRRLLNLVNQLLDISKLDGCKMKVELTEASVMQHLRAITGAFTSLAETKSIHYICHVPA